MANLSDDLRRFLDHNIEAIDQLEILRVLWENQALEWATAALAVAVQVDEATLRSHLTALQNRGLLTLEPRGTATVLRYGPKTPELADSLNSLLRFYKERPVTMIKLVYARGSDPLRNFADAFRLRKEGG